MGRIANNRTFYDHIVIGIVRNGSQLSRYRNKARKLTNFRDIFSKSPFRYLKFLLKFFG